MMKADGSDSRKLTSSTADQDFNKERLIFSTDQKYLLINGHCRDCELIPQAYSENTVKHPYQLFLLDLRNSQLSSLTSEGGSNGIWLPDGQHIIFSGPSDQQYYWDFYVINVDGSEKIQISNGGVAGYDPIWIPAH
jgi:hypothetical protein